MARSKKQKRAIAQRISQKRAKKENERAKSLRPNDKNHHVVHGIFVSEGLCYRPCLQFMFLQHKLSNNQRPSNDESSTDGLSFILSSSQNHLAPITQNSLENCAESYDSSPASTVSTILNSAETALKEQPPDTGQGLDSSRDSYLQHGSCYEEQEVIALESRSVGFISCTASLPSDINNELVELIESVAQDELDEIDKKLLGKFICHSTTKTIFLSFLIFPWALAILLQRCGRIAVLAYNYGLSIHGDHNSVEFLDRAIFVSLVFLVFLVFSLFFEA